MPRRTKPPDNTWADKQALRYDGHDRPAGVTARNRARGTRQVRRRYSNFNKNIMRDWQDVVRPARQPPPPARPPEPPVLREGRFRAPPPPEPWQETLAALRDDLTRSR